MQLQRTAHTSAIGKARQGSRPQLPCCALPAIIRCASVLKLDARACAGRSPCDVSLSAAGMRIKLPMSSRGCCGFVILPDCFAFTAAILFRGLDENQGGSRWRRPHLVQVEVRLGVGRAAAAAAALYVRPGVVRRLDDAAVAAAAVAAGQVQAVRAVLGAHAVQVQHQRLQRSTFTCQGGLTGTPQPALLVLEPFACTNLHVRGSAWQGLPLLKPGRRRSICGNCCMSRDSAAEHAVGWQVCKIKLYTKVLKGARLYNDETANRFKW